MMLTPTQQLQQLRDISVALKQIVPFLSKLADDGHPISIRVDPGYPPDSVSHQISLQMFTQTANVFTVAEVAKELGWKKLETTFGEGTIHTRWAGKLGKFSAVLAFVQDDVNESELTS